MCHLFIWPMKIMKIALLNGLNGSLSSLQKQNSTNSIQLSLLNWNTTIVLIRPTYILFHYVLVISTSNKKNQDHQAQTHFCAIIKPCKLLVLKDTVVMPSNNCIWLWKKRGAMEVSEKKCEFVIFQVHASFLKLHHSVILAYTAHINYQQVSKKLRHPVNLLFLQWCECVTLSD